MELTEMQQAAIRQLIDEEVRRRVADELDRRYGPEAAPVDWPAWLRGAARSWTVWSGGLLVVLPELMAAAAPLVTESLGPAAWQRVVQVIGIVMVLLRVKTKTSLAEKGAL